MTCAAHFLTLLYRTWPYPSLVRLSQLVTQASSTDLHTYSMRTVGVAQRALDLMITRVTDPRRKTFGKHLYEHGVVVERVAKARMELDQARLLVLVAAIQIDTVRAKGALRDIGIAKVRSSPAAQRLG